MRSYEWWLLLGIPTAWVVLFLVYSARCLIYGRHYVAGLVGRTTSAWLPRMVQEFGYWLYQTPVRGLSRLGITANMLTIGSLLLAGVAAVLIGHGRFGLGGWVLLLGFTMDVWDGMVARLQGQASRAGEFLDATIDRYSDLVGLGGFLYYYREQRGPLLLVLAALIGSTLVSYTRAKGECLGVVAEVGYMRRYERAVWLGVGTVLSPVAAAWLEPGSARPQYHLLLVVMALLAVLANVTAVWRIGYVLRELSLSETVIVQGGTSPSPLAEQSSSSPPPPRVARAAAELAEPERLRFFFLCRSRSTSQLLRSSRLLARAAGFGRQGLSRYFGDPELAAVSHHRR